MNTDCAVLITAAGFSGRMGISKALLKWNAKLNFLQKLMVSYSLFGCKEIIVTLNEDNFAYFNEVSIPSVRFILNPHPERERMYSIQLGLKAIKNSSYCFIQVIDNPFIEVDVLKDIYSCKSNEMFVTPVYKGKSGHPILINKSIIEYISQMEVKGQHLKEVLSQFPHKVTEVEHPEILYNINTMEDYNKLVDGFSR